MRRHPSHPRIRKTIKYGKYGGAALTVLLVLVWIGSGWYGVRYWTPNSLTVAIEAGNIEVLINSRSPFNTSQGQWMWYSTGERFHWWPRTRGTSAYRWLYIPVWIPALLSFVITALAFRLDTLARRPPDRERGGVNLCPKCHYDRTGLAPDSICPECGTPGTPHPSA